MAAFMVLLRNIVVLTEISHVSSHFSVPGIMIIIFILNLNCESLKLKHLAFADKLMIFDRGDFVSKIIVNALDDSAGHFWVSH